MRCKSLVLLAALAGSLSLSGQTATTPPQSARQALIEMFMGKDPAGFAKHLPETARQTLIRKGETPETSVILRISAIGREAIAQGEKLETFDTGPNLLVSEQNEGREKIEVAVERDSLIGEDDEIELSVHYSKDGQPQALPVVPRLIFTFRQEKEIWRLTEITAAAHVPLTDPDYLKGLRKQQDESNESSARMRLTLIAGAETAYVGKHPDHGYSCTLASLFAQDPASVTENSPPYYGTGMADQESSGYRFTLTGCDGVPATKYRITAVPIDADAGLKTFCADESGTIKSLEGGKSSSCFSRGQPVNAAAGYSVD